MGESDWILPVLGIGGLAIGAIMVLPGFMKNAKGEEPTILGPTSGLDDAERFLEEAEKREEIRRRAIELERSAQSNYPSSSRIPMLLGEPNDAYVITDEDFDKLDIGKKDKRFLNRQRKLRDAKLERVVYGDNRDLEVSSYFVNTVSPYGQGPSPEFTRLVGPQDNSNTNTRTNTINLY
jgi:hypothetical protein